MSSYTKWEIRASKIPGRSSPRDFHVFLLGRL